MQSISQLLANCLQQPVQVRRTQHTKYVSLRAKKKTGIVLVNIHMAVALLHSTLSTENIVFSNFLKC